MKFDVHIEAYYDDTIEADSAEEAMEIAESMIPMDWAVDGGDIAITESV